MVSTHDELEFLGDIIPPAVPIAKMKTSQRTLFDSVPSELPPVPSEEGNDHTDPTEQTKDMPE